MLRLRPEWRQPATRIAAFLLLLAIAGWPWTIVRSAFSSAYCATVGAALPLVGFRGGAGRARVLAAPPTDVRRAGENVTSDADVELSLEGSSRHPRLGVNLRRDAYLPLLLLIGAVAVAPLRPRSKAICLLAGVPIVLAASFAALVMLVGWVFAGGLGPPEALQSHTLDLMVRMLLEPPGNRFIGPLVLAAILILWRLRRERTPAPLRDS
ncbi:MAG TPA: hypothetical protein VIF57_31735 [Polyangia bacterium]|jgi:hypothetical protein